MRTSLQPFAVFGLLALVKSHGSCWHLRPKRGERLQTSLSLMGPHPLRSAANGEQVIFEERSIPLTAY